MLILKNWDYIAQKDDFNSFIPATIKILPGANPTRVTHRWLPKDIPSFSRQP